jgi:hypothetical protein
MIAYIYVLTCERKNLVLYDVDLEIEPSLSPQRNCIPTRIPIPAVDDSLPDNSEILRLSPGDALPCGIGVREYSCSLTKLNLRRWTLAANGAREMHERPLLGQAEKSVTIDLDELLAHRLDNRGNAFDPYEKASLNTMLKEVLVKFCVMPFVYGTLNLAGLGYAFASQIERVLWIAACGIIMALELPVACLGFVGDVRHKEWMQGISIGLIFWVLLARIYLVVGALYSLRSVSIGVYVTVDWLNAIPHL